MGAVSAKVQDEVLEFLGKGQVDRALEKLSAFADARQNDLPSVSKECLAALGEDPAAVRSMTTALFSTSATLRRFARKTLPKMGMAGPSALALALVESLRPFRRGGDDAFLGSFDGFASPLAAAIAERKLSFEVPPQNVYGPAQKTAREILEVACAALADGPLGFRLRVFEWASGFCGRGVGREKVTTGFAAPDQKFEDFAAGYVREFLEPGLRTLLAKEDPEAWHAVGRWARGALLLDDGLDSEGVEGKLAHRFASLDEGSKLKIRCALQVEAVQSLGERLPPQLGLDLYWNLKVHAETLAGQPFPVLRALSPFERARPKETAGPAPSPLPILGSPPPKVTPPSGRRKKAKATASDPSTDGSPKKEASTDKAPTPLFAPWEGPSREDALESLLWVAVPFGLRNSLALLRRLLEDDAPYIDEDELATQGADANLDAKVLDIVKAVESGVQKAPERVTALRHLAGVRPSDSGNFLPEGLLASLPHSNLLAERIAALHNPLNRIRAALGILSAEALRTHSGNLEKAFGSLNEQQLWSLNLAVEKAKVTRSAAVWPFVALAVEASVANRIQPSEEWMMSVAIVYRMGGEAGRKSVLRILGTCPAPVPESMYRRHQANPGWHWFVREAWRKKDTEVLAALCESLYVPMYFKGTRAMIPSAPELRASGTAPYDGTAPPGEEWALSELVTLVAEAHPERLQRALERAAAAGAFEKGAAALLAAASTVPSMRASLRTQAHRVLDMVQAAKDSTQKAGLLLFAGAPTLMVGMEADVLRAVRRAMASASPGVLQSTAEVLGALAQTLPEQERECVALLEELLHSENVPTLVETMKVLKGLLAAKRKGPPLTLSSAARKRIARLGETEPKKLGKLATALLG